MIDQNILYSACPCGSGKKFKFCCYQAVRKSLPPNPSLADVTQVIRVKADKARLQEYADDIRCLDFDDFHRQLGKGLERMRKGDIKEAKTCFLEVKEKYGMLPAAYNNLAICALIQGDLDEAEDWLREVTRRFPGSNSLALAMLADVNYLKGNLSEARDLQKQAEELTPSSIDQALRVCESLAHVMEHERIVRYIESSGYADDPDIEFLYGVALANLGRTDEAVRALRVALDSRQSDYARKILSRLLNNEGSDSLSGDWMYFTPRTYVFFKAVKKMIESDDSETFSASEAMAEFVEVVHSFGKICDSEILKVLGLSMSKRGEHILSAMRENRNLPDALREEAQKVYDEVYGRNDLGRKVRESERGIQQMIVTEEAASPETLGASNYVRQLCAHDRFDEAKAVIENYHLPLRIHPDAYLEWLNTLLMFYEETGDFKKAAEAEEGIELLERQLASLRQ